MGAEIYSNASFHNIKQYFKSHGKFTKDELKAIIITIAVLTFVVAYNDGAKTFELSHWLKNLVIMLVIVTASVFVKQYGYKISAAIGGFKTDYQVWWYGAIAAIIITILSRGHIWLLIPGAIVFQHLTVNRLGFFRYGANVRAMSMMALGSNLALIVFGGIFKTLDIWISAGTNPIIDKLFLFTIFYAAWSLVPIPPLDGSKMVFESRLIYSFVFGSFAGYAILVALGIYSYIWGLVIGGVVWLVYYIVFEKDFW